MDTDLILNLVLKIFFLIVFSIFTGWAFENLIVSIINKKNITSHSILFFYLFACLIAFAVSLI